MPRPTKHTPELVEQMIRLIEAGVFAVDACFAVGIHEDTYYHWLKTKSDFSESIKKARAMAIVSRIARIERAGREGDWKADAWWLERVARERFGRHAAPKPEVQHIVLGFRPQSPFIRPVARKVPQIPRKKPIGSRGAACSPSRRRAGSCS